jgi:hypothetical protein
LSAYTIQMMRDTLENWQSEFLQLLWQVAGLAMLLHVGSPQSKEGDDRMEAKIDAIRLAVEPEKGNRLLDAIDHEYEEGTQMGAPCASWRPELDQLDSRSLGGVSVVDSARSASSELSLFSHVLGGSGGCPRSQRAPASALT